jgi:hypothetical protein
LLPFECSPEDLQQLVAWYKIRDTLLGQNRTGRDIKKALDLASVSEHTNAVWLTKLFAGLDVASREEAREVFLGCGNDPEDVAGVLGDSVDEIRRAADLGDAFAQAWMAWQTDGEESFRWAGKSAVQGERDGFFFLGHYYRGRIGCEKDLEKAKENFLVASELGHVHAMVRGGRVIWQRRSSTISLVWKSCCRRGFFCLLKRNNVGPDFQLQ